MKTLKPQGFMGRKGIWADPKVRQRDSIVVMSFPIIFVMALPLTLSHVKKRHFATDAAARAAQGKWKARHALPFRLMVELRESSMQTYTGHQTESLNPRIHKKLVLGAEMCFSMLLFVSFGCRPNVAFGLRIRNNRILSFYRKLFLSTDEWAIKWYIIYWHWRKGPPRRFWLWETRGKWRVGHDIHQNMSHEWPCPRLVALYAKTSQVSPSYWII